MKPTKEKPVIAKPTAGGNQGMKYKPWNVDYQISYGGSWAAHLKRNDAGVDYKVPKDTPLFSVYEYQIIRFRRLTIPPGQGWYPGTRKIVICEETDSHWVPTGRTFERWHIKRSSIKAGSRVSGRREIARSGKSGAASPHVHCFGTKDGVKTNPTGPIARLFK